MKKILATGVFDLLHPGHIFYLEKAKNLGDELIVVVARDSVVIMEKAKPILPESLRLKLVSALKTVDQALLGSEEDMYEIVLKIKPQIIALGHDQKFDEKELRAQLKDRGADVEVVRIPKMKRAVQ